MKRVLDPDLSQKVRSFGRGVFSFIAGDGFPFSLPVTVTTVRDDKLELNIQRSFMKWLKNTSKSCLLFHSYEDGLENLRQLLFRGSGMSEDERILFEPKSVYEFRRKGGILSTLRFIIRGKKEARRYLEQRAHPRSQL